ncbi:cache domain-containing protein [bacterium]|jgi:two-component system, NtrC family, sensor kinase|nr:cache domain-containing protein [bacterium]
MNNKEQQILKFIKYTPSAFILVLSIIITLFFYFENKETFLKEKEDIKNNYILENKNLIKEEVNRVYDFILKLQNLTEIELKNSIKSRVYEAHTIANSIYNKYKNQKSKEEIFELIKTALEDIRYNDGRGYFFIIDNKAVSLLQPSIKGFENKNLFEYADKKGYKFMQTIVKTIEEKTERFDQYYWKNPSSSESSSKKISFYKYFEPLNIAIGSGEYVEDYEKEIKQKALDYINLIRFRENGYIFIINYDGIFLSHIRPEYIGKEAITNNDTVDIKNVINDSIQISRQGEGYYSYIQNKKPDTNLPTHKVSFLKGLNNWEWMIGTGFYEDDINEVIEQKKAQLDKNFAIYVKNIFILSIFLTLILLVISKYVSKFLENKFDEYKKELKKKQSILYQQSKMAAMGEMIGNIAHQWRQPLSTISTSSTGLIACKNLDVLEDSLLLDSLNKINNSAQYLSNTIDDFRNFFNPNKIKNEFSLKNSIKTTFELISAQFNAQNIHIIKNIEDIRVCSYENELIQALINILNNARDALKNKGNELDKRLIFIDILKKDKNAIIKIKDNAGGINDKNIKKIFEPYFTTKQKSEGTGIGLYMTQEIIVKHLGGEINVSNKSFIYIDNSYTGAEFEIKLPIL